MEIWRSIEGYEGVYEASNYGRVRSLDRMVSNRWGKTQHFRGRVLSPGLVHGYHHVLLSKNGQRANLSVHRLVATAFCEKASEEQNSVNHRNGIKTDNAAVNLEWLSNKENMAHAWQTGLKTGAQLGKLTQTEVNEIRRLCAEGYSRKDIAYIFDITQANVSSIILEKTWKQIVQAK